ncbi:unnamed protein product [Phaedon cochleariae]|uniref:NADH dehydrogenase [ubiquinone] 1 beta subcomplex subunit 8, mitochondrial n=1 Tax=Phaedon cochleariae TaxID=80249 RepID=A0A9P0GUR3_PHACE|nr:unnamed protein product [Phaedon cochleariae]
MNNLAKSANVSKSWLKTNPILFAAIRNHWNKDYKPAAYPRTENERIAAAEKYQLQPEEYQPYPDDGSGRGDYPNLPAISGDSKDPFYPWDHPELKRNFNEPMHADFGLIREDRYDVNAKLKRPLWFYWAQHLGTMIGLYCIYSLFENVKMFHALVPKQFPNQGKTHYTFERE